MSALAFGFGLDFLLEAYDFYTIVTPGLRAVILVILLILGVYIAFKVFKKNTRIHVTILVWLLFFGLAGILYFGPINFLE